MTVKEDFETGQVGWEILFIMIAGMIGDMFIHLFAGRTIPVIDIPFSEGLVNYYENLKIGNYPLSMSIVLGALFGGIACVVALLLAKLFLYSKEETEKNK